MSQLLTRYLGLTEPTLPEPAGSANPVEPELDEATATLIRCLTAEEEAGHSEVLATLAAESALFWQDSHSPLSLHALHPCVIQGKRYLIHHPQLEDLAPSYYLAVSTFAKQHHQSLRKDQRSPLLHAAKDHHHRRKPWLPVLVLSASLGGIPLSASADSAPREVHLNAITSAQGLAEQTATAAQMNPLTEAEHHTSLPLNDPYWQQRITRILLDHWQTTPDDPHSLEQDLKDMAGYFSRFPAVQALFQSLENGEWQLTFAPKTFATSVTGSRLHVDHITVQFDPHSAAQFKFHKACRTKTPFCVASPADVLLHELLHTQSILADPEAFIAEGGMNSFIYPYQHERQTIEKEKLLYQAMSKVDQVPRPLRSEHTGRHIAVACTTCIYPQNDG